MPAPYARLRARSSYAVSFKGTEEASPVQPCLKVPAAVAAACKRPWQKQEQSYERHSRCTSM
jgi:hypothetical protein